MSKELDFNKFANTVLYLLERSYPERPGTTSLLKMLWYADYWHYREHLKVITGGQYVALVRGPVLDGYKDLFQRLEREGIIEKTAMPVFGQPIAKDQYVPKMDADDSQFTESEREILAEVIRQCADKTGLALSHRTHREGPWQIVYDEAAKPPRVIPRSVFRWLDNMPTDEDIEKAKKTLARGSVQRDLEALSAA